MPAECKYCGESISVWYLLYHKLRYGSFPECGGCGADDDTLEVAKPNGEH